MRLMKDRILKALAARRKKESLAVIANKIGVDVRWLYNLADGKINDPGLSRSERLGKYLKVWPK